MSHAVVTQHHRNFLDLIEKTNSREIVSTALCYLLSQFSCGSQNEGLTFLAADVELFESGDGERGRFASSRLRLCDDISSLDAGHDSTLLDSRRLFKTISVDS